MPNDQSWAENQLRHRRNAYLLALAALRLLNSHALQTLTGRGVVLRADGMIFDPVPEDREGARFEFLFDQLMDARDQGTLDVDMREFYKFVRRNLVKESFEIVRAYAKQSGRYDEFRSQAWYLFSLITRNAISHDFTWKFNDKEKNLLPIQWGGKTIDARVEGLEITQDVLDPFTTLQLIVEMANFVSRPTAANL